MHLTEYFAIVEREIEVLNLTNVDTPMRLAEACAARDASSVIDVGRGTVTLLTAWSERCAIDATGLEINPHFVARARRKIDHKRLRGRITIVEGPARDFPAERAAYDVASCIGATFALENFAEALTSLVDRLHPHDVVAIGAPSSRSPSTRASGNGSASQRSSRWPTSRPLSRAAGSG